MTEEVRIRDVGEYQIEAGKVYGKAIFAAMSIILLLFFSLLQSLSSPFSVQRGFLRWKILPEKSRGTNQESDRDATFGGGSA